MTGETREIRLKRLKLRSWRRGTREMDLILGGFSDGGLSGLAADDLDLYEALLEENDHDIYGWITGRDAAPDHLRTLLSRIAEATPKSRDD